MDSRASTANSRGSAAAAHESSAEGNTTSPQQVVEPSPPLTPLAHPVPREPPPPYPGTPCRVPYSSTISSSGWNHPDTYLSPFVPDHDFSSSDLGNNRLSGIIRIDDDSQESRRRRLGSQTSKERDRYESYMNLSLCLLIACLFVNPPSLICTLPAVVLSWKAVLSSHQNRFTSAEKFNKWSTAFLLFLMLQSVVVIVTVILGLALFILFFTGRLNVR